MDKKTKEQRKQKMLRFLNETERVKRHYDYGSPFIKSKFWLFLGIVLLIIGIIIGFFNYIIGLIFGVIGLFFVIMSWLDGKAAKFNKKMLDKANTKYNQ